MALNFINKIRQAKFKDVIYPVVTILGFSIFLIMFALSVRFLLVSINRVFSSGVEDGIVRFDLEGFKAVSGRLNIGIEQ